MQRRVNKGFCGTPGATAPSGTGPWHVPPDGDARRAAKVSSETRGMHRQREHAATDQTQRHRLLSGGLDEVWVSRHAVAQAEPA